MKSLGLLLYGIAGLLAVVGIFTIWIPAVGILVLAGSAIFYFSAQAVQREARRQEVRRQQGSDWLG